MVPLNSMATLFKLVVSRTVAIVYFLSRTTVPPLSHDARAAAMAGPSSEVPPATSQVVAIADWMAKLRRLSVRMTVNAGILRRSKFLDDYE